MRFPVDVPHIAEIRSCIFHGNFDKIAGFFRTLLLLSLRNLKSISDRTPPNERQSACINIFELHWPISFLSLVPVTFLAIAVNIRKNPILVSHCDTISILDLLHNISFGRSANYISDEYLFLNRHFQSPCNSSPKSLPRNFLPVIQPIEPRLGYVLGVYLAIPDNKLRTLSDSSPRAMFDYDSKYGNETPQFNGAVSVSHLRFVNADR
jgi:hypothetical protein